MFFLGFSMFFPGFSNENALVSRLHGGSSILQPHAESMKEQRDGEVLLANLKQLRSPMVLVLVVVWWVVLVGFGGFGGFGWFWLVLVVVVLVLVLVVLVAVFRNTATKKVCARSRGEVLEMQMFLGDPTKTNDFRCRTFFCEDICLLACYHGFRDLFMMYFMF